MLRTAIVMFALAVAGCVDDDPPVDDSAQIAGDNDPDVQAPDELDDQLPANCHALDGDADNPICKPK